MTAADNSSNMAAGFLLAAPTVDELVRGAVANMAIEGYECTSAEIERVRARLTEELARGRCG